MSTPAACLALARTDAHDRLIEAEEPLAGLQRRCGGELPGTVAIPELLQLVRKSRSLGLRLGRTIQALDGRDLVKAWVEVSPEGAGHDSGCTIALASWQAAPLAAEDETATAERRLVIDRQLAELTARLDRAQRLVAVDSDAADLRETLSAMHAGLGRPWTEFVELEGNAHRQPLHWRLLDGARCSMTGSERRWTATVIPLGAPEPGSAGFELLLVPDRPLAEAAPSAPTESSARSASPLGRELSPVLRQPIGRIIANAETIRARMAGPLADEYSDYAADIAAAGQHLLSLVEDLADLEAVEAEDFSPEPDRIELTDVVRRAAGILAVRAQQRSISLQLPATGESQLAAGEFRRVLQVLLNLIGNALTYAPQGSTVRVSVDRRDGKTRVTVADEGPGLTAAQQTVVFDKFERLGRSGDGGSGLGLYISRKLARAMGGDLTVESTPGEGARFILSLPALDERRKSPR